MFSFILFLFFLGFFCLMNTSKRISWPQKNDFLQRWSVRLKESRLVAGLLFLLATVLAIYFLGLGAGIFGALVMLMAIGCLSILFFPFRYIGLRGVVALFIVCLVLELIF